MQLQTSARKSYSYPRWQGIYQYTIASNLHSYNPIKTKINSLSIPIKDHASQKNKSSKTSKTYQNNYPQNPFTNIFTSSNCDASNTLVEDKIIDSKNSSTLSIFQQQTEIPIAPLLTTTHQTNNYIMSNNSATALERSTKANDSNPQISEVFDELTQEEMIILEQDIAQSQRQDTCTVSKAKHTQPTIIQTKQVNINKNQYSVLQVFWHRWW
jgi:hypothetical protein